MIELKHIKPIPKYIQKQIIKKCKLDIKRCCFKRGFYAYLTKYNGELAKVTVAVRYKNKKWYCKQVAIHGIHNDTCFVKDMEFYMISGYVVGWYEQGLQNYRKCYETENWCFAPDKYYDPIATIINPEFALKFKEFKYSCADRYKYCDLMKFLRLYEKYPQAEYLMKLNLDYYATSKMILKQIDKDKKFRTWLIQNQAEIFMKGYYVSTILKAYKEKKSLEFVQQFEIFNKTFMHSDKYQAIKEVFNGDIERFFLYLKSQKTNDYYPYFDYLTACKFLEIDMTKDKNLIPHDFKKWHDIRIDEYHSKQAEEDEKKRKELYEQFAQVANKYLILQRNLKDKYITLIAKSPVELVNEGEKLHHCVGRMGYDQKFAREETLIFFIRLKDEQKTPLVTVEYSIKKHKVLQCYADHDSKPCEEIENYVYKTWLPYANRKIRQIAI